MLPSLAYRFVYRIIFGRSTEQALTTEFSFQNVCLAASIQFPSTSGVVLCGIAGEISFLAAEAIGIDCLMTLPGMVKMPVAGVDYHAPVGAWIASSFDPRVLGRAARIFYQHHNHLSEASIKPMTSLVIRNLSDQLVELVRDRILSGEIAMDRAIKQDALAAELGVSKIPLREALARLEEEGLLRSQVNRGFFVRPLSAKEAEEVYALRLKLEPDAVAQASVRASDEDRSFAVEALKTLDQVTSESGQRAGALNRAFHLALIRPSGLWVTTNFLERLHVLSERYVRKHLEPLGRNEQANVEHTQMLQTWLSRDSKAVAKLVREHISRTLEDLRKQLADFE